MMKVYAEPSSLGGRPLADRIADDAVQMIDQRSPGWVNGAIRDAIQEAAQAELDRWVWQNRMPTPTSLRRRLDEHGNQPDTNKDHPRHP